MVVNMGIIDRVVRVIAGALLIAGAVLSPDTPYSYLGWLGLFPIATAFVGYCPFYTILGVKTN